MSNKVYVLATNASVGSVVEQVYRDKLNTARWEISLVPSEALSKFRPEDHSLVVVDRRLTDYLVNHLCEWSDREVFCIPFDEVDFDGIHTSLLACSQPRFDAVSALVQ